MKWFTVKPSPTAWPTEVPALRLLEAPPRLRVPLLSHPGAEPPLSKPAGSLVAKGEVLCSAGSRVALSPISGRVIGTGTVQLLNGFTVPAVDIEADFEDRALPGESHDAAHAHDQRDEMEHLDRAGPADLAVWIDRLQNAGVWAERPGSPDLMAQLHGALRQPVDTLICNLLDDEPTMRLNSVLAGRVGPMMLAGVGLIAALTGAKRVCLMVEAGSPGRWWVGLRRLARKAKYEMIPIVNDYPQADASLLILALLGRRLKPGRSPVEQKALVLDAAAAVAVGRCAIRARPMLQMPVAIRDHIRHDTHFVLAPIGMSLRQILQQCDIPTEHVHYRRGAVLRENEVRADAVVAGGELTVHVMPEMRVSAPDPCIRCSWCAESCPTNVQPAGLLEAAQINDLELAKQYGLDSCIECGVCSYMCPSRLPLLEGIRTLKNVESP